MRVLFGGKTYALVFCHLNADCQPGDRSTTCAILELRPDGTTIEVAYGEALCHWRDNYVRETGRKVALTRALAAFPGDEYYEFRKAVWAAYHSRCEQQASLRRRSRLDWQAA